MGESDGQPDDLVRSGAIATGSCQYILNKRQRLCKFAACPPSKYCTAHDPSRSRCPLDPHHTVRAPKLGSHIGKCSFLRLLCREALQPFYSENVNSDTSYVHSPSTPHNQFDPLEEEPPREEEPHHKRGSYSWFREKAIAHIPNVRYSDSDDDEISTTTSSIAPPSGRWDRFDEPEHLNALADVVGTAYHQTIQLLKTHNVPYELEFQPDAKSDMPGDEAIIENVMGDRTDLNKHDIQCCAIVKELRQLLFHASVPANSRVYLELGAGKGRLTQWLLQMDAVANRQNDVSSNNLFVLIERGSRGAKKESKNAAACKEAEYDAKVVRLRTDIVHFNIRRFVEFLCAEDKTQAEAALMSKLDHRNPPSVVRFLQAAEYVQHIAHSDAVCAVLEKHSDRNAITDDIVRDKLRNYFARTLLCHKANVPKTHPHLIFAAKHLCGSATDLGLRILLSLKDVQQAFTALIQPCCFHGVTEQLLINVDLINRLFQHTDFEFQDLVHFVGWSNGRTGMYQIIGRQLRFMFLAARAIGMSEAGFKCQIKTIISPSVTPENTALIVQYRPS